jgi:formylglycine-generating enzyme required for sulfatase activity/tRNA A-37 threonylcarbamoyl transferase component Bud32
MTPSLCPASERLHEYVHGKLDRATHEHVEQHLDACTACQAAVETLDDLARSSSSVWRRPVPAATSSDPALAPLVARVKALHPAGPCLPATLGNYVLLELLGTGGMGQVFKAEHRRLKRLVAVKVLAPELLRSEAARARFQREMELVASVHSPHVVAAHDAGTADGRDFLVMEYVPGRALADLVKETGPLPVAQALRATLQAARGLADAHAAGIVHRDVKPANLLLDDRGTVKVLDLGLARLRLEEGPATDLTASQVVMGTAAYMAPEQAADTRRADQRSDVYSLGCSLYYLLTGRPPYEGGTVMEVLFAHRERPVPSVVRLRPDCPAALDELCKRLLAKRPEDRPASMSAVAAELERVLARDLRARRPAWRRLTPWLVAAVVLLAGGVLLAWPFLPPVPSKSPVPDEVAETRGPPTPPTPPAPDKSEPTPRKKGPPPEPEPAVRPQSPAAPEMVLIRPGDFWMGSPDTDVDADADEKPRHRVTITQPLRLARYKVTQAEYEAVTGKNPSAFGPAGRFRARVANRDTGKHPVESISWLAAVQFCNLLSERQGLRPYYTIKDDRVTVKGGPGYRLPTEAEWEYACRAGTETRWYFGDNPKALGAHAWFSGNSGDTTHPVGEKGPNPWGLYDMAGNVPEWCWDRYDPKAYRDSPQSDPSGPGSDREGRVYRGGAWNSAAAGTRSAARHGLGTSYDFYHIVGLRLARDAEP